MICPLCLKVITPIRLRQKPSCCRPPGVADSPRETTLLDLAYHILWEARHTENVGCPCGYYDKRISNGFEQLAQHLKTLGEPVDQHLLFHFLSAKGGNRE